MPSNSQRFRCNEPVSDETMNALIAATEHRRLPSDYLAFLRSANGGEGLLEETDAGLWRAEELMHFDLAWRTTKR